MSQASAAGDLDLERLTGHRLGPYLSFNPVSRVQVWQWCSAMGDRNPLYLDDAFRAGTEFDRVVAPPAMMQMWTQFARTGNPSVKGLIEWPTWDKATDNYLYIAEPLQVKSGYSGLTPK